MVIVKPILIAAVLGIIVLFITRWLKKSDLSIVFQLLPGILTVIAAVIIFSISYVNIRGTEGMSYGFLSITLMIFAIISLRIVRK
ncbi:YesK family protein [Virgibacillus alimentarius]|uniref:YesK-like protein n=1 Tax=Virgibacillus alimentarius TaxID=698769 RepID=A0ABS4SDP9_9BACI|nr:MULTISPECIES: YesK family protein [Virgibacillus]MBP2258994.1 hypothetical protein [Virgibacillus alimentarius]HLR68120.1 YesK family protein [Virgibacillus sp.]